MEEFKIFLEAVKSFGLSGALAAFIAWDRFIYPQMRKRTGKFVHWKDLKQKLDEDNQDIKECKMSVKHVEKLVETLREELFKKENKITTLEVAQQRHDRDIDELKYMVRDIGTNIKTNNRLQGELKDTNVKLLELLEKMKPKENE